MDFIFIPAIFGIVTLGIYKIFELFVGRKERLMMIEKFGHAMDTSDLSERFPFFQKNSRSFATLRISFLLLGLGLGLMVGFFISSFWQGEIPINERMAFYVRETVGIIYGASVLLFGGLGLLVAFLLEQKYSKTHSSRD